MADKHSVSENGNMIRLTGKGIGNKTSVKAPVQPVANINNVNIDSVKVARTAETSISDSVKEKAQKAMLHFVSDPGHGWLAVSIKQFPKALDFASQCSYIDHSKGIVYLEEDKDAPTFVKHYGLDTYYLEDKISPDDYSPVRDLPIGDLRYS